MSYYPDFARLLNDRLVSLDRSPAWLARRLDVNPSTVNRWLNHGSRPGDSETVVRIADILGMSEKRQDLLVAAGYGYQEVIEEEAADKADDSRTEDDSDDLEGDENFDTEPEIPTNLPKQATALVGRLEELAAINELCADPTVRLITIMGPGGMGKTRLALAAAEDQHASGRFPDGVYYVSLTAIVKRHNMVTAIADALELSSAGRDMEISVLKQLQAMTAIVLLDNFEQMIPEADFVADLLDNAPNVKLIITSRARLNLQEEWAIDLHGLRYPAMEAGNGYSAQELRKYEAVDMFLQRVEQVNSGYMPTPEDIYLAAEISQLVQGMPLALELAAGWTRYMMLDEIIQEIERSIDFFSTTVRNVPERHRSLRAVFRQSWHLLSEEEQLAYATLSVFRGGFSRQAAAQVAGVSLPVIASLVDKSLISRVKAGHYEVQDMLRQFAAEILSEDASRESAARLAHAKFYCGYLAERTPDLLGSRQLEALKEISSEKENIRAAWNYAIHAKQYELLASAVEGWFLLAELGGYIQQGYGGLHQALQAVERGELEIGPNSEASHRLLHAKLLSSHALINTRYGGPHPQAISELQQSLALLTDIAETSDLDVAREKANVLNALGLMIYFDGDEEQAESLIRSGLEIAQEKGYAYETGNAWSYLAHLEEFQGRFTNAAAMFSKSIEFFGQAGESNRKAYALNNWGRAAYGMGDYEHAESLVLQALEIRRAFNDLVGIAYSLLDLGEIADCRGEYAAAEKFMQSGLAVARTIDNDETVLRYYIGLADVARHTGNLVMADSYLNRARDISRELVIPSHSPVYLAGLGKVAYQRKGAETARALFTESLTLAVEMGNQGAEAEVRFSLAKLDLEQSQPYLSAVNLKQSLAIAMETGARPVALAAILLCARFSPEIMPAEFAPGALLAYVVDHPAAWRHTRMQAQQILDHKSVSSTTEPANIPEFSGASVDDVTNYVLKLLEPLVVEQMKKCVCAN